MLCTFANVDPAWMHGYSCKGGSKEKPCNHNAHIIVNYSKHPPWLTKVSKMIFLFVPCSQKITCTWSSFEELPWSQILILCRIADIYQIHQYIWNLSKSRKRKIVRFLIFLHFQTEFWTKIEPTEPLWLLLVQETQLIISWNMNRYLRIV